MDRKEAEVIAKINAISERGNSAEVKKNKDGEYVVYEIQKKRRLG